MTTGRYVLRRLGQAVLTLWGLSVIVFLTARLRGDPAALMLASGGLGNNVDPAQLDEFRAALGLDAPLSTQYLRFLGDAVRGDLGYSFWQQQPVTDLLLDRVPATAQLAVAAAILGLMVGLPAGVIAGRYRARFLDNAIMGASAVGLALPVFWTGPLMILVFAVELRVLPAFGYGAPENVIMPAVALALPVAAQVSRLVRSETVDIYQADYIQTATSKGLSRRSILRRHALRGIIAPVVPLYALELGALLGAAVITETIFAWPGIGRLILEAVGRQDLPLIQGGALLIGVVYVLLNLVADLAALFFDPHVAIADQAKVG